MENNKNKDALLKVFDEISQFESDNSGYSIGKSTIRKVFDATQSYSKEDLLARLTIIDSMYSTQMNRRYYGLEELAEVLSEINKKQNLAEAFLGFLNDKDLSRFQIKGKETDLFAEKYGIGKNGEDKGLAVSLISKYAYFETRYQFPIYDSIVREMYPRIWSYCGFPQKEMPQIKTNDICSFIDAIDILIAKLNHKTINYDTLDRVLWYVGKIQRGNLSLILSRAEYDAFVKKYSQKVKKKGKEVNKFIFDIVGVDLETLPLQQKSGIIYDFFVLAKKLK